MMHRILVYNDTDPTTPIIELTVGPGECICETGYFEDTSVTPFECK